MMRHIDPMFVEAVGHDLDYWTQQVQTGDDRESQRLLPEHGDVLQTVRLAVALPVTHRQTVALVEKYLNMVERNGLAHHWLPVLEKLCQSNLQNDDPELYHQLRWRYAVLLRVAHRLEAAKTVLEALLPAGTNAAIARTGFARPEPVPPFEGSEPRRNSAGNAGLRTVCHLRG